ncbi:putative GDP-L-fucose synthase [Candidatus Terasakiella magnetica]|uniref:Putative GDP-L-fucose synthase n=1 Tax=Candidatus Terasakiella magnetica TaxID=1867952 RepID=A0A1C3RKQ1_9PROT|nr:NAD(P)-dependent oxidoreductase [Candidatus Terasakiella magnetica]SCA57847.1 putative GDP-L-fucose synthase [Candidatus Terasakiella magnetica]
MKQNHSDHWPKGRYVLFGASGLAGTHALNLLKDQDGISVLAVSNSRLPSVTGENIEVAQADLTDSEKCLELSKEADYVLAFAGVVASAPVLAADPIAPIQTNLKVAVNCIEAAWRNGVKHCVWLSSTTGYPALEGDIIEEQMFDDNPPGNWFGLGWMTRYVEKFAKHISENVPNPIPVTCLRPSLIYGENDHFDDENAHFLPALIRRVILREKPIEVWGTGEQERDVIHAEDVARAAFLALNRAQGFRDYNIAFGKSYNVNHMLSLICSNDNFDDAEIVHLLDKPQSLAKRAFSIEKAQKELGFEAKVSLNEGLKRTIDWYRETI